MTTFFFFSDLKCHIPGGSILFITVYELPIAAAAPGPESVAGAGRAHLAPDRSWRRKAKAALSVSDQVVGRPLGGPQGESLLGLFQFLLFPLQGPCEYTGLPG